MSVRDVTGGLVRANIQSYDLCQDWGPPRGGGMGAGHRRMPRGAGTYERIIQAGCTLVRREGTRALSMRAVAEAASVSLGAVQFHFGTQDDLAREVVRAWAEDVSRALEGGARDLRGLSRTWKLCENWAALSDGVGIAVEALRSHARGGEPNGARAMLLESLRGWVEETRRSLRQAQLKHELKPEVDIRAIAIEFHQLLWSSAWTSALYGPEASTRTILGAVWQRLAAIAADPSATLPPFGGILAGSVPHEDPTEATERDRFVPTWKMLLEATDPLYQAFERHEIMDDPRTFLHPPEITPEDIARAEALKTERGSGD